MDVKVSQESRQKAKNCGIIKAKAKLFQEEENGEQMGARGKSNNWRTEEAPG